MDGNNILRFDQSVDGDELFAEAGSQVAQECLKESGLTLRRWRLRCRKPSNEAFEKAAFCASRRVPEPQPARPFIKRDPFLESSQASRIRLRSLAFNPETRGLQRLEGAGALDVDDRVELFGRAHVVVVALPFGLG